MDPKDCSLAKAETELVQPFMTQSMLDFIRPKQTVAWDRIPLPSRALDAYECGIKPKQYKQMMKQERKKGK